MDVDKRYKNLIEVKKNIDKIEIDDLRNKSLVVKTTQKIAKKCTKNILYPEKELALAIANLNGDLSGKTYICAGKNKNSYMIVGKQYTLICCIDKENKRRLSAVDIRFYDASYLEMLREQGLEIPYMIKFYANSIQSVSNEIDANDVLEEARAFFFAERNNRKKRGYYFT